MIQNDCLFRHYPGIVSRFFCIVVCAEGTYGSTNSLHVLQYIETLSQIISMGIDMSKSIPLFILGGQSG